MNAELAAIIAKRLPDWVAVRRDLHAHPELGNHQTRPAKRVADHLRRLGAAGSA